MQIKQKVFDTFLYSGEKNLLEFRLSELNSCVDTFVILESSWTFSGKSRIVDWNFRNDVLSRYGHKVRWEVVEEIAPGNSWMREAAQRQRISSQLIDLSYGDIVMLSDVDEIPSEKFIESLKELNAGEYLIARMLMFRYCPHFLSREDWFGTIGLCFDGNELDFQSMRKQAIQSPFGNGEFLFTSGGNHYTSFLSPKSLKEKIRSFSHTELDVFPFNNSNYLTLLIHFGIPLDGKEVLKFCPIPGRSKIKDTCSRRHRLDPIRVFLGHKALKLVAKVWSVRISNLVSPS